MRSPCGRHPRVSPPTRGWTPNGSIWHVVRQGFPAHAGMDPVVRSAAETRPRFPRPRGDGPAIHGRHPYPPTVSPPTRGWTVAYQRPAVVAGGFPAHAGMDPGNQAGGRMTLRFPRPRGDGPASECCSTCPVRVSPPTRGWTHGSGVRAAGARGFPAHAGMDPWRHIRGR